MSESSKRHSKFLSLIFILKCLSKASVIKLISSSDTLTKRETVILKICPPAIITSAEVIIAEYDAILGQWERADFYNHLSNYTKYIYRFLLWPGPIQYYGMLYRLHVDNYHVNVDLTEEQQLLHSSLIQTVDMIWAYSWNVFLQ